MTTHKLFTERELAPVLAVSVKTLQSWRLSGAGPQYIKMGRSVRYRQADVDQYLNARVTSSTSQVVEVAK